MKDWLKRVKDVKHWQRKTKITTIIVITALIVCTVLAFMKPSEAEMMDQASPQMKRWIEKDQTLERKRVTTTYNNMIVINYISFSTSGADGVTEKYSRC